MLVSVDDSASLHPPQAALRLRRPTPPRQGISSPGPRPAIWLATKTRLVSASLVYVARQVPGRKKSEKNPREKINLLPRVFFAFQTVRCAHRPASAERWQLRNGYYVTVTSCSQAAFASTNTHSLVLSQAAEKECSVRSSLFFCNLRV